MKRVYMVSVDFNRVRELYGREAQQRLFDALTSTDWCRHMDETWFIATTESTRELQDRLAPLIGERGVFFVIVPIFHTGLLGGAQPKAGWEWIKERVPAPPGAGSTTADTGFEPSFAFALAAG